MTRTSGEVSPLTAHLVCRHGLSAIPIKRTQPVLIIHTEKGPTMDNGVTRVLLEYGQCSDEERSTLLEVVRKLMEAGIER
jgi:hypothetical protein